MLAERVRALRRRPGARVASVFPQMDGEDAFSVAYRRVGRRLLRSLG